MAAILHPRSFDGSDDRGRFPGNGPRHPGVGGPGPRTRHLALVGPSHDGVAVAAVESHSSDQAGVEPMFGWLTPGSIVAMVGVVLAAVVLSVAVAFGAFGALVPDAPAVSVAPASAAAH